MLLLLVGYFVLGGTPVARQLEFARIGRLGRPRRAARRLHLHNRMFIPPSKA